MKRLIISGFWLMTVIISGCRKSCVSTVISDCIKNTIETNKNKEDWGVKAVEEYEYQGKLVYIFVPEQIHADMQTEVTSSNCTPLCFLGGITGNQMCNGDEFYKKAVLIRKVWQK